MIMHGSRNFWLSASCTHTNKTHSTIKSIPSNNIKEFDVVAYKKIQGLRMKTIRKLYFYLSLPLICFEVSWHFVACERSKKFIEKYISYVIRISILYVQPSIFSCIIIYVWLIFRYIFSHTERILTFLVKQLWWQILKHRITVKDQSDTTI